MNHINPDPSKESTDENVLDTENLNFDFAFELESQDDEEGFDVFFTADF